VHLDEEVRRAQHGLRGVGQLNPVFTPGMDDAQGLHGWGVFTFTTKRPEGSSGAVSPSLVMEGPPHGRRLSQLSQAHTAALP
jgi:hypothetical protein